MNLSLKAIALTSALIALTIMSGCSNSDVRLSAPTKNLGFLVTVEAKPGQETNVAQFLASAAELAEKEEGTLTWYAFRIDETHFGIFDTFHSTEARQAHLNGKIAEGLIGQAPQLFAAQPSIKPVEILASK
ncbi:MAG: antibiotic biosynthesis monooxygenase [Hellea sp.]